MSPIERMKKVHIWIGSTSLNEEEYKQYFDDPESCQFCKDIGQDQYDEDFIGILPLYEEEIPIKEILNDVVIDHDEINNAVEECAKFGIKTANAVFYLTDADVIIKKPYKEDYNGLKYIGIYNSDL